MSYTASWEVGSSHTVTFQPPAGYNALTVNLSVTDTELTCTGCATTPPAPYVSISGYTLTAHLKEVGPVPTSFTAWIESKGGTAGLRNNGTAIGEIIDGYYGLAPVGFTVTGANVGAAIDAYYGIG